MKLHSTVNVHAYQPSIPDLQVLTEEDHLLLEQALNQEAVLQHMLQQQRDQIVDKIKRRPGDYLSGQALTDVRNNPDQIDSWKDYGGKKKIASLNHANVPFLLQLEKAGTKRHKKVAAGGAAMEDLALYFIVLRFDRNMFRDTGRKRRQMNVYDNFLDPIEAELKKIYGNLLTNVSVSKWALDKTGHQFRLHFAVPTKAKEGVTVETAVDKAASMIVQMAGATRSSTQEVLDKVIDLLKKNPSVNIKENEEKEELEIKVPERSGPKTLKEHFLLRSK